MFPRALVEVLRKEIAVCQVEVPAQGGEVNFRLWTAAVGVVEEESVRRIVDDVLRRRRSLRPDAEIG